MNLFYTRDITGELITLGPEESRHALQVLRLRTGDTIFHTDGEGGLFESEIVAAEGKKCVARVVKTSSLQAFDVPGLSAIDLTPGSYHLHMAVAPTKNIDRFEWFLEKATEIGVGEVTPLICEHSERKVVKPERLEKVIISAMKQSLKIWKPRLNEATRFGEFIRKQAIDNGKDAEFQSFIAHLAEEARPLKQLCTPGANVTILIGPEGDFSDKELQAALASGFRICTLGTSRLRTETAAVVACTTVAMVNT